MKIETRKWNREMKSQNLKIETRKMKPWDEISKSENRDPKNETVRWNLKIWKSRPEILDKSPYNPRFGFLVAGILFPVKITN